MTTAPPPPACETLTPDAPGPALILCDHASNHVPDWVAGGDLGVSTADMARHIAYDVGAAGLARALAGHMSAPAVLSQFSRLVIDPNRGGDDPTLVMQLYDGSIIPANRGISAEQVALRKKRLYEPYHQAIATQIDRMQTAGTTPQLISIHSFTPQLRGGADRPWHIGILWDRDESLARPLIDRLREEPDLCIGDNQPYTGQLQGDCLYQHGTSRGLPHVLIELRNDLIKTKTAQAAWAARLAPILSELMQAG